MAHSVATTEFCRFDYRNVVGKACQALDAKNGFSTGVMGERTRHLCEVYAKYFTSKDEKSETLTLREVLEV